MPILKSFFLIFIAAAFQLAASTAAKKPNIIFILADDLGYGDLGCFGQTHVKTPILDKMAAEGIRLTSFYAGSTVCAPSRSVLMTGQDTGHTWVRGNGPAASQTLRPEDVTVAEKLKEAGYATALCGKWGLGEIGSTGHPNRQGFDYFYGYLNQRHAHNFYPEFIIRQQKKVRLRNEYDPAWVQMRTKQGRPDDGAGWAKPQKKLDYVPALVTEEALKWVDKQARNKKKPFFLYYALNIPHANNEANRGLKDGQEIPSYGQYADKDWSNPDKGFAAMNSMMDRDIGRLVDVLKKNGVEKDTLIFFTSDNGHHKEGGNNPEFFNCNGPLRGMKRDLYEGGIRVPTVAWWPDTIPAGIQSDHTAQFADFMATACELAGVKTPSNTQSTSFVPTLLGKSANQKKPEFLYWEFYERNSKQAVRFGKWKAIRQPMFTGGIELYDLDADIGESKNLAGQFPKIVETAKTYMEKGHKPNPNWKVRSR